MFTGLIEAVSKLKLLTQKGSAATLAVDLGHLKDDIHLGDSIAVNGLCLTVAKFENDCAFFDVSGETLSRSTISKLKPGQNLNIERALKLSDRLGGHIVQGHVDGTAKIAGIKNLGDFSNFTFSAEKKLLDQMVPKGSVAVDGISLTIANLETNSFTVAVIPETLKKTTLGSCRVADTVNIEIDILSKMIKSQIKKILGTTEGLTIDKLKEMGF